MATSFAGTLKRDNIYERIRHEIITRKLSGGQQLSERKLADTFGVARATVRVSLLRLAGEGLVDNVQGVGVFVREYEIEDVKVKLYLREIHEGAAARFAATRTNRVEANKLQNLVDRLEQAIRDKQYEESNRLDIMIHYKIAELCGDKTLEQLIHSDHGFKIMLAPTQSPSEEGIKQHRGILAAIINGDGEKAENLMRQHISEAAAPIIKELEDKMEHDREIINGSDSQ